MAGTFDAATRHVDRLLVRTIVVAGLVALVEATYLLVVIGLGHVPTTSDRKVLASSMLAAAVAALLSLPARHRLEEVANQRVYGERRAPDEPLRTFAGRMSRAVPLDELLAPAGRVAAQEPEISRRPRSGRAPTACSISSPRCLIANRRRHLALGRRADGRGPIPRVRQCLGPDLDPRRCSPVGTRSLIRVASVTHLGQLLGLIVVERPLDGASFAEADDRGLTDLARQVGLALHNVQLDSALQASLDELRNRNRELRASRARIVAASDDSRRQIERNLHDGAQQHLVAMAVKLGLARRLLASRSRHRREDARRAAGRRARHA